MAKLNILTSSILVLSLTASSAALALVPWEASTSKSAVSKESSKSTKELSSEIKGTTVKYVRTITDNTSKILEAIRVATSQEALSATQVANADLKTKQILVAAMNADNAAAKQVDVILDYGAETGQGYAACQVYVENKQMAQAMKSIPRQTSDKVNATDNAPGAMAVSEKALLETRKSIHEANFCTRGEELQGICRVTNPDAQGADSNASVLFESAVPSSAIGLAKGAVRQNIMGSPPISIPESAGATAEGQAYLAAVNHKTALSAFPAYSLAYLESMSEIREDLKDKEGNPMSPNDLLFNTVARYYGGKDAAAWQASMTKQQPRGLLVELAKMEGVSTWLELQKYKSYQRMQGIQAASTLASTLPIEDRLKSMHRTMNSNAISGRIHRQEIGN